MALLNSGPIVIAGGSGFLGTSLATWLTAAGHHVIVLSRRSLPATVAWESVVWDGRTSGPWIRALDGAQALVNLTGRSVDCIKSPDHCDEILRSRVESTRILGIASKSVVNPPPVWVQMSTAHIMAIPRKSPVTKIRPQVTAWPLLWAYDGKENLKHSDSLAREESSSGQVSSSVGTGAREVAR